MKKLISTLICICLLTPAFAALADAGSATEPAPTEPVEVVDFVLPEADLRVAAESTIMRAALMDRYMGCLALQAFYVGEGWTSQSQIYDPWAAVYSYMNTYELSADTEWEHTDQGFVRIDADYVRRLFVTMYGHEYEQLPPISRSYSSVIVYDAQSDVYDVSGSDGETVFTALSNVALGPENSAIMTYSIVRQYVSDGETVSDVLGTASVHLESSAEGTFGFMPVQIDLETDSVG